MNALLTTPVEGGIAYHHADGRALSANDIVPAPTNVSPVEIEVEACAIGFTASHPSIAVAAWGATEQDAVQSAVIELAERIAEHAVAGREVVVSVRRVGR